MKRIAAPMAGGIFTSLIMELTIFPALFYIIKGRKFKKNESKNAQIEDNHHNLKKV